ncbi:hypothetical protein G9A89_010221 [Geosiphon pyriformis]|nr:hypothetical protein G9A89_010221 [Geosiphon pyriformis]
MFQKVLFCLISLCVYLICVAVISGDQNLPPISFKLIPVEDQDPLLTDKDVVKVSLEDFLENSSNILGLSKGQVSQEYIREEVEKLFKSIKGQEKTQQTIQTKPQILLPQQWHHKIAHFPSRKKFNMTIARKEPCSHGRVYRFGLTHLDGENDPLDVDFIVPFSQYKKYGKDKGVLKNETQYELLNFLFDQLGARRFVSNDQLGHKLFNLLYKASEEIKSLLSSKQSSLIYEFALLPSKDRYTIKINHRSDSYKHWGNVYDIFLKRKTQAQGYELEFMIVNPFPHV